MAATRRPQRCGTRTRPRSYRGRRAQRARRAALAARSRSPGSSASWRTRSSPPSRWAGSSQPPAAAGAAAAARPRRARAGPRRARRAAARRARRRSPSGRRAGGASACCSSGCCSSPARYRFARISRQRPRRARLRGLAGQAAARPDRHADGLVAGQALLRLSVSQGPRRTARGDPHSPRLTRTCMRAAAEDRHRRRPGAC